MVEMHNGVHLVTDLYLDSTFSGGPVLLVRTPYDTSALQEMGERKRADSSDTFLNAISSDCTRQQNAQV